MNSQKVFEQLYSRIDHFFSAEWNGDPVKKSGIDVLKTGPDNVCLEWDLNQKYSDIAARDFTIIFNKVTPLILRKIIVMINQFLLFYFLTDQEFEIVHQGADNKHTIYHRFNHRIYRIIRPFSDKTFNKEGFTRFYTSLEKTFRNLCDFIRHLFVSVATDPESQGRSTSEALDFRTLRKKTTSLYFPKLISSRLFHKRI